MKKINLLAFLLIVVSIISFSFQDEESSESYQKLYSSRFNKFEAIQHDLLKVIDRADLNSEVDRASIRKKIQDSRFVMKGIDFWLRYLEPVAYKKINGPLPVEWETEVFEKYEKPYKREGAGLTLAAMYLDEPTIQKDSLRSLIQSSIVSSSVYTSDSILKKIHTFDHFYLCNRLYLLNLAAIYTTGFECPDQSSIIPELIKMLEDNLEIYECYNKAYVDKKISDNYLSLYNQTIAYCKTQPLDFTRFDHFTFIKDYVNPLYKINQQLILLYHASSRSYMDYTLNNDASSIFDKSIYQSQNTKGIFYKVNDPKVLAIINQTGKKLFYDPIISGNNSRSCVSCHKPTEYFTDTTTRTSLKFDQNNFLARNSPTLINAGYNHLLMLDGKHYTLQSQCKAVMTNKEELGSEEEEILKKVMSCSDYKNTFKGLLKYTPLQKEVTIEHIISAITFYYSQYSEYTSPFDDAMNRITTLNTSAKNGFNIFMSKAQCATCHFVPQFNGVKPPFIGSEFEVLGVPIDNKFSTINNDVGRYSLNPAEETMHAFRTGSIRNSEHTKPYMHNGVFNTLDEVINFYNNGGGIGHGINVTNQTLSSDSLHLTSLEKEELIDFIKSLTENIKFEEAPKELPQSRIASLKNRKVGGLY